MSTFPVNQVKIILISQGKVVGEVHQRPAPELASQEAVEVDREADMEEEVDMEVIKLNPALNHENKPIACGAELLVILYIFATKSSRI